MKKVLATMEGFGAYEMPYKDELIQDGSNYYLLYDTFGGMDSPRGGAYRQQKIKVERSQVETLKDILERHDELGLMDWVHFQA